MQKLWKSVLVLIAATLLLWGVSLVTKTSGVLNFLCVILSIVAGCLFITAIVKQFLKRQASVYRIFAWTDGILTCCVILYAVYDILTDTGWFAGLFGVMLLVYILPVLLLLLLADYLIYKVNARKQKKTEE